MGPEASVPDGSEGLLGSEGDGRSSIQEGAAPRSPPLARWEILSQQWAKPKRRAARANTIRLLNDRTLLLRIFHGRRLIFAQFCDFPTTCRRAVFDRFEPAGPSLA